MKLLIKCILGIIGVILITLCVNRALASSWMLELCKKELPTQNPTSHVFSYPLSHVREAILEKFNKHSFRELRLYGKGTLFGEEDYFDGYNLRDQPGTENDFILAGDRVLHSFIYRTGDRGRYCNMKLQIHLDSISPVETRVEVISHDRQIISGYKLGIAHMSMIIPVFQTFKSTTVEEYQVLYNLGKFLGEDMPRVIYPKALSEKQIFETFHNGQQHLMQEKIKDHLIGNEK